MGGIGECVLTASQSSERPNWLSLIITRIIFNVRPFGVDYTTTMKFTVKISIRVEYSNIQQRVAAVGRTELSDNFRSRQLVRTSHCRSAVYPIIGIISLNRREAHSIIEQYGKIWILWKIHNSIKHDDIVIQLSLHSVRRLGWQIHSAYKLQTSAWVILVILTYFVGTFLFSLHTEHAM